MRWRSLIPLAILAILGAGTAVFAVVGGAAAPNVTTIDMQNATGQTFGTPTGSVSFLMDLINTLSSKAGAGTLSQERLVDYTAPDRMVVYPVGGKAKFATVLHQPAIDCALSAYNAMLGGSAAWTVKGDTYRRTESLAVYTSRVPRTGGSSSCAPQQTTAHGQVYETAIIRSGYLVAERVQAVVQPQTLPSGQTSTHGIQGETLVFVQIGGVAVRTLKP